MGGNKIWKIAMVGLGGIAEDTYMAQMPRNTGVEVVAFCDIKPERTAHFSQKYGIDRIYSNVDDLLANEDFDILMDTASIQAHYEINMKALKAGKHLYSQKPIGLTVAEATDMIEAAKANNVKFAASPIHMLRPDIIEARRLIKNGILGKITLVRAMSAHGGPEYFQYRANDPSWFFEPGAGALYDMGVHALHTVTGVMGPAKAVSCMAAISQPSRTVRSGSFDGKPIDSNKLYDNYMIHLDFGGGAIGDIVTGFCVKASTAPSLEIYGEYGAINFVQGGMKVYLDDHARKIRGWIDQQPQERPAPSFYQCSCIMDLIAAIEEDRQPAITAEHARHVIEIMCQVEECAADGTVRKLSTTF
ncbi:MAG: Gfo/Idh/MocA family oxidoreductase [Oscillospiraceae bacterium]|nr:Gfo/Idh/MocA family oxidoreductase [Oscillospiraceae bacterium]